MSVEEILEWHMIRWPKTFGYFGDAIPYVLERINKELALRNIDFRLPLEFEEWDGDRIHFKDESYGVRTWDFWGHDRPRRKTITVCVSVFVEKEEG